VLDIYTHTTHCYFDNTKGMTHLKITVFFIHQGDGILCGRLKRTICEILVLKLRWKRPVSGYRPRWEYVIWIKRNTVISTGVLLIRYRTLAFAKFEVYTSLIYRSLVVWLVSVRSG